VSLPFKTVSVYGESHAKQKNQPARCVFPPVAKLAYSGGAKHLAKPLADELIERSIFCPPLSGFKFVKPELIMS